MPVFAGSSTDDFYQKIIPLCFENVDIPQRGDVGVLVYENKGARTLAHSVLFVDSDKVFEKPSPEFEDKFRYNSWQKIKKTPQKGNLKFEVYRFKEKPGCPFEDFNHFYADSKEAEPLRKLQKATEQRLRRQNWQRPLRSEREILKSVTQTIQLSPGGQLPATEVLYRARIGEEMVTLFRGFNRQNGSFGASGNHDDMEK